MENNFTNGKGQIEKGLIVVGIFDDTIVAISSAQGRAGVGVVRVSGSLSRQICVNISDVNPQKNRFFYSDFRNDNGEIIDSGIVLFFEGPNSFTGEDTVEFQAHGNPLILRDIVSRVVELGARQARPGEFTERSFRNGKISLDQAEAVADLIAGQTKRATLSAARTLTGLFATKVNLILNSVRESLFQIEALIDFHEDLDSQSLEVSLKRAADEQIENLNELIRKTEIGVRLREGVFVAIVGSPNVGKSTLLNKLAGSDKAIVSDVPGTTRDPVEITIDLSGIPVHFVDTAGIRETSDQIEATGIERTKVEAEKSDIILYLHEEGISCDDGKLIEKLRKLSDKLTGDIILVRNKIDLLGIESGVSNIGKVKHVNISAYSGRGMDALLKTLLELMVPADSKEDEFVARERHLNSLRKTFKTLRNVSFDLLKNSPELVAEEYRQACHELDLISGKYTTEELLGDIFSRFCIGK